MSKFTVEDMLANRVEELEDAHAELYRDFLILKSALIDLSLDATDTDREDFLNGMTDLEYARRKLAWVRAKATEALEEVDFSNES
jgi:hypothetical protein